MDIGADVNVGAGRVGEGVEGGRGGSRERAEEQAGGWDDQTPICLAVHSQMKAMVELLLDLGASNVHAALKLSRELKLDDITGILLKNIALDRNGDTVNLSGIELRSVKPQWILPCLGVSESLRLNRLLQQSSDRIKDLLMRRKSIGCIEDKTLERLRADMEGVNREGGGAQSADDGRTDDETDSGVPKNNSWRRHRHRRSCSGNVVFTPSKEDFFHNITQESSFIPPQVESSNRKKSKSPPPSPEHNAASPSSPVHSIPQRNQCRSLVSSTPKRPTGQGISPPFRPTLPPIHGTPVSSLQRPQIPPKWSCGEGMESSEEVVESSTSPLRPSSCSKVDGERRERGGGGEDSRRTLVHSFDSRTVDTQHPRMPQRRHHNKLTSLMIQKGTASSTQRTHSFDEPASPKKPASVSPAVLLRRVSMWGKNHPRQRKRSSTCSTPISHPESPPARIYIDVTTHSRSEDSRDSTPVPLESMSRSSSSSYGQKSSDEGIWTGPSTTAPPNTSATSLLLSPSSDSTDGEGGLLSLISSTTFSSQLHTRRKPSSFNTAYVHVPSKQSDGSGASKRYNLTFQNHLLEEREKITSARLVRTLDLSSNLLDELELMVGVGGTREESGGGELVLKRLKGLHRLDLKQNHLRRLPRVLMRELKKLTILNLSCNSFDQMPAECVLSPALTSLDLSSNKVSR